MHAEEEVVFCVLYLAQALAQVISSIAISGGTSGLTGGPMSPTFHNGKPVAAAFDKKIDMNDNVPVLPASGYSTRLLP